MGDQLNSLGELAFRVVWVIFWIPIRMVRSQCIVSGLYFCCCFPNPNSVLSYGNSPGPPIRFQRFSYPLSISLQHVRHIFAQVHFASHTNSVHGHQAWIPTQNQFVMVSIAVEAHHWCIGQSDEPSFKQTIADVLPTIATNRKKKLIIMISTIWGRRKTEAQSGWMSWAHAVDACSGFGRLGCRVPAHRPPRPPYQMARRFEAHFTHSTQVAAKTEPNQQHHHQPVAIICCLHSWRSF